MEALNLSAVVNALNTDIQSLRDKRTLDQDEIQRITGGWGQGVGKNPFSSTSNLTFDLGCRSESDLLLLQQKNLDKLLTPKCLCTCTYVAQFELHNSL